MKKVTDVGFNPSNNDNIAAIKTKANELAETIANHSPAGRRQSIALTHLETASMFAVKAAAVGDD